MSNFKSGNNPLCQSTDFPYKTGAAYIRVSTEEQTEFSPDSQLKKIQEYAVAHNILLTKEFIFVDEGLSGRYAAKRPAFMQMIQRAKEKPRPFDVILLWKFSRFARNRQDSILYKTMLRKECGIDVISITEQLSRDPTSILVEALLEAMDEYYSINLAQEVRRGMNEKFSRGGVVSAPPFGYRMGKEHFEIAPENALVVRHIFEAFLAGKSCREIAAALNAQEISTARGCAFQSRTIKYILENPVYTGRLRRHLYPSHPDMPQNSADNPFSAGAAQPITLVSGKHQPIISEALFAAVQKKLIYQKKVYPKGVPSAPADFMLKGLVRCSFCGGTLTKTAKGKALQCHRYTKGQCSESHYISLEKLNNIILDSLSPYLSPKKLSWLSASETPETEKHLFLHSILSSVVLYKKPVKIDLHFHNFFVETKN